MVQIELSNDFGYVILTGLSSAVLLTYLGFKVGHARRRAGVPYPHAYATKEECEKDNDKMVFNCHQRAHQNTLEFYPGFLFTLVTAGIKHPILASVGGGIWILGRLVYAWGYYTGEPKKRTRGAFGYIGSIILLGASVSSAVSLLYN
uniref:Glutathione S-transferase 3, mitochondrial n=1 Tax=Anthurium amnicola TaxID=1678845 RepID=A0A1D1XXC9_9ARAE